VTVDNRSDFDPRKLSGGNMMFPSSGSAEGDASVAELIRGTEGRLAEGICPNGDGRLVDVSPSERYCDTCRFVQQRFTIGAG
jgi:hypothetical protein